ncbi:NTR1 protein, partial [Anseranas semipalmata]|nr:NTR1 protein [Anseranas semipalmata]
MHPNATAPAVPGGPPVLHPSGYANASNRSDLLPKGPDEEDLDVNTDIYSKVMVTVIYLALFLVGTVGNSITAYTLVRKKSLQNLQSTVHYHLASLAFSDLLIFLLCMPIELYNFIWVHHPWAFGGAVCKGYYFLRDACTYATALNIASLSVERYMAICHPFKAKSIMSRSRTKKFISCIWIASFLLAIPMIFTMGEIYGKNQDPDSLICTTIVDASTLKTVIQVNTFISFVFPMVVISVLNTIIANQLLVMFRQAAQENQVCTIGGQQTMLSMSMEPGRVQALKHGVRVLRAVVIAFVVCWLPYHIRRLMFCYVPSSHWTDFLYNFYHYFYMLTNVLFYVSSAINPILYNLVSANFRQIFLSTLTLLCLPWRKKKKRLAFTRKSNSISSNHTFSSQVTRETTY